MKGRPSKKIFKGEGRGIREHRKQGEERILQREQEEDRGIMCFGGSYPTER
jgi:hypothetical protein